MKSGRGKEKMEAEAKVLAVMEVGVAAKLLARSTDIIFCSFMNYSQTHWFALPAKGNTTKEAGFLGEGVLLWNFHLGFIYVQSSFREIS